MTIDSKTELKMPGAAGAPAVTAQAAGAAGGAMPASSEPPPPVAPMPGRSGAEDPELPAHPAGGGGAAQASAAAAPASPVASPAAAPGAGGADAAGAEDAQTAKPPWKDIDLGPPPRWEELISAWRYLPTPPDSDFDREFGRLYDAYEIVEPSYARRFLYHNRDLLAALFVILPQFLARPDVKRAQIEMLVDPESDNDGMYINAELSLPDPSLETEALFRLGNEIINPILGKRDDRLRLSMFLSEPCQ